MRTSIALATVSALAVLAAATPTSFAAPRPTPTKPERGAPKHPEERKPVSYERGHGPAVKTVGPAWTAAEPDAMVSSLSERAKGEGRDALAAMVVLTSLKERASAGSVAASLAALGQRKGKLAQTAQWLHASLTDTPATQRPGLVKGLAVLGPFQDTSGRVKEPEFDEGSSSLWGSPDQDYSRGVYEVRWRVVRGPVSAQGLPLDAYISPRKESCTYVASRISLAKEQDLVLHVAAGGAVRLIWDGATAGTSEEVYAKGELDRLGARVHAVAGEHLLAAKVCTSALDDDGLVRLRLSTPDGQPASFASSGELAALGAQPFHAGKMTPLLEPLQQALQGETKVAQDALSSAVIRSLAGADDQRSPKTSALVEQVAADAHTSPDMLALAGWVSPFGAARSGWLNLARSRAQEDKDASTAAFAERRIIGTRMEQGFGDWAMAALGSESFRAAKDPEAELIRALVRSEVSGMGAAREAARSLHALAESPGAKVSEALLNQLISLDQQLGDSHGEWADRQALLKLDPMASGSDDLASAANQDNATLHDLFERVLSLGTLASASDLEGVADLLMNAGLQKDARDLLVSAVQQLPNEASLHAALAKTLFTLGEHQDVAMQQLASARALAPTDAELKAQIAYRGQAAPEGASHGRTYSADERWMPAPEVFLARARSNPAVEGEVFEREVHWLRVVTLHEDQRVSQLIHYAREIVVPPKTQEELYENIPVEGESAELVRARVHRADGTTAFAEEQRDDGGSPGIRWPQLHKGDIVEVAVRSWTQPIGGRGDAPYYFFDYAGAISTTPLLYNEVVIDTPASHELGVDVIHGKADRVETRQEGSRHIARYVWDHPVTVPDEPLAPKASELVPTIIGSSFRSWDDFRNWYRGATAGFTDPDPQVREMAEKLTKGKTTREEKLQAIFNFVADDIRYVNYTSAELWLPNRPSQLLARRQGDCDDKAMLLITLLKSVGIDATEVLIQTRYTGQPSVLLSEKAAIPLFDHGIAYLPASNGQPPVWLDATSPQSRLGTLPSMDARTYAMFVSEGPAKMVPSPDVAPKQEGFDAHWDVLLSADGLVTVKAEEVHRGDSAFLLRMNLQEKDARAQWATSNLLSGWLSSGEVVGDVGFDGDIGGGQAKVTFTATSRGMTRHEGSDLILSLAPVNTITSMIAPLVHRTLPVVLDPGMAPSMQSYSIRLHIPDGWKLASLPESGDEGGGESGRASTRFTLDPQDPHVLVIERAFQMNASTIPPEKYDAWRAWLIRVDALRHRFIRLTPG